MSSKQPIPVRVLPFELVERTVVNLLRIAVTSLPRDVMEALEESLEKETSPVAKIQLETILENIRLAEDSGAPMCQDTGIPLFFLRGHYEDGIEEAIRNGVEIATKEIPLRPNAVHPLTRENPGTNIGKEIPHLVWNPSMEEMIEITVMPKGAGSENMSRLAMLKPSDGIPGIKKFVLDSVVEAGGKPCPPTIVGLGIGGSSDIAPQLAKKALMRPLDVENPDPMLAELEHELKEALNATGIGPMGLGGRTTVLGVKIESAHCHTASLPLAVCLQCWAGRRACARIYPDGMVSYSREGFD
ncbi:MAG TPA: fumarate hydratase [Methanomassiliicoccales archaeon]|nr:fumarate hydratase [Methanomassiliicoccales archaeon]